MVEPGQPAAQPDGDDAEQHAGHAERHDQRVDPEHADGQPVDEPDGEPDAERHGQRRHRALPALRGRHVGGEVGGHGDRQVDAAGQHAQRLAGGEDGQRAGEQQDRADAGRREQAVVLPDRDRVEDGEHADQHERRLLGEAHPPARPGGLLDLRRDDDFGRDLSALSSGSLRCRAHAGRLRRCRSPATSTTRMMITPRAVSALLGSQPSAEHDRRDQRQAQRRQHRADEAADAAGQGDAAEHGGGDAVERGVRADRRPGLAAAGRRRDDEPGEPGEEPADRVGEHAGPGDPDAGQERRLAVAAEGVDGEPEAAAPQRHPHERPARRRSTGSTATGWTARRRRSPGSPATCRRPDGRSRTAPARRGRSWPPA